MFVKANNVTEEFGEYIYHYTTMKALFGIIKNKEFWWGNTSTMNDKKELVEFTNKIENAVRKDFGSIAPDRVTEFCKLIENASKEFPFAMCFSSQEEDASQWERYGDRATGVCLKINTRVFADLLSSCNVVFNNVYYDSDIRKHKFYEVLDGYFKTGEIKAEGVDTLERLVSNILTNAPSYKNRSFWAECERRVYTLIGMPFCKSSEAYRYEYECKDNEVKRYLKIKYDLLCAEQGISHDMLFEELVVGPRSSQNLDELRTFLVDLGFPRLAEHIRASDCPLR